MKQNIHIEFYDSTLAIFDELQCENEYHIFNRTRYVNDAVRFYHKWKEIIGDLTPDQVSAKLGATEQ